VTSGNWRFLSGICDHFAGITGTEVQRLDLSTPGLGIRWSTLELITDRMRVVGGGGMLPLPESLTDLLAWADCVFVDWCDNTALWAALHVPRTARLVIRLHSVEALSSQPHLMDWNQVADLVFVSEPIKDLTESVVSALMTATTRKHVIPNYVSLADPFTVNKADGANRTVVMVGWSSTVKDPLWAVDVLSALLESDDRWRLLLVGNDFPRSLTASGARYRDSFERRIQQSDVRNAVVQIPYNRDLPSLLTQAGFVLSTSRRESFHIGLVEGAAGGCIPVIRNWPLLAPFGGPRALFPKEWIVDDVVGAAERILWYAAEADRMRAAAEEARDYVVGRYDWSVVAPQYEKLLLGENRAAERSTA
jgi:glycosyltransferase involved in cell wall biosynthesis